MKKKYQFLSLVCLLLISFSSIVYCKSDNLRIFDAIIECEADCTFGSCSASCDQGGVISGGGGAICTCYGGFPSCGCGEGHSAQIAYTINKLHLDNMQELTEVTANFNSEIGIIFHKSLIDNIRNGILEASTNERDISRYQRLRNQFKTLNHTEKEHIQEFIESKN